MAKLNFRINGQSIIPSVPNVVVSDTINYLTASVTISDKSKIDYEGLNIWLHFKLNEDTVYDFLIVDGYAEGIDLPSGTYSVYAHASSDSKRITTNECTLRVEKSGILNGSPLPEIPVSVAEQIAFNATEARAIAQSVRDDASAGLFNGKDGKDGADGKDGLNGLNGKDGRDGLNGKDGANGKDGYTPVKGIDYFDGKDGANGADGKDGKDGINGQNGKDGKNYVITEADYTSIANIAASKLQPSITELKVTKQNALISGINIKTVNNQSLLGEGNIKIEGGGGSNVTMIDNPNGGIDLTVDGVSRTIAKFSEIKEDLSEVENEVISCDILKETGNTTHKINYINATLNSDGTIGSSSNIRCVNKNLAYIPYNSEVQVTSSTGYSFSFWNYNADGEYVNRGVDKQSTFYRILVWKSDGFEITPQDAENAITITYTYNHLKYEKGKIGEIQRVNTDFYEIGRNKFNGIWHTGFYRYDGVINTTDANYKYTDKIYLDSSRKIKISSNVDGTQASTNARFIACFDENEKLIRSYTIQNVSSYTFADDVKSVILTFGSAVMNYEPMVEFSDTIGDYESYNIDIKTSDVRGFRKEKWTKNTNEVIKSNGYMNTNGDITSSNVYVHSQKISVKAGDVVSLIGKTNNIERIYTMRFICAFVGDSPSLQDGKGVATYTYTVPNGIDGIVVSTSATAYNSYKVNVWRKSENTSITSTICGKSIVAFGDSLIHGHMSMVGMLDNLAIDNGMMLIKYAINGSTVIGSGNGSIYNQIHTASDYQPDYVVFDGLTNDCFPSTVVGEITDSFTDSDFVKTEFAGAFEFLCFTLRNKYPNAKILYVAPHSMPTRTLQLQNSFHNIAKSICRKWGITVADIYGEGQINTNIPIMCNDWSYDNEGETSGGNGTHLTGEGYKKWYQPLIKTKLEELI